jgi:hypothetical protein
MYRIKAIKLLENAYFMREQPFPKNYSARITQFKQALLKKSQNIAQLR